MHIYITRHGQPDLNRIEAEANPDIPLSDPVLSRKGRMQAEFLGEFLKYVKFQGVIISSPYRRTLETAYIISTITSSTIHVKAEIQEMVYKEGFPEFEGLTIDKIRKLYPSVSPKSLLPSPWLAKGPETLEKVKARVAPFLNSLLSFNKPDTQILLVGHGASVHACKELLLGSAFKPDIPENHNWNCSLSTYIFDDACKLEKYKLFDIGHLPEDIITSNKRSYSRELQYAI